MPTCLPALLHTPTTFYSGHFTGLPHAHTHTRGLRCRRLRLPLYFITRVIYTPSFLVYLWLLPVNLRLLDRPTRLHI